MEKLNTDKALEALVSKGIAMRQAQQKFFTGGKMKYDLQQSKGLERSFDDYLNHLKKLGYGQTKEPEQKPLF